MLLTRQQLEERLVALHRASLELVKDVSLETLLERIATVALEQVNARYAALGVLDENGKLKQFITVGMTPEQIRRIPHPPVGKGLIAAVMDTEFPVRISKISEHPRSVGFPAHHPAMNSFLGVPIRTADRQLGQIYLSEKIGSPEFTQDDEGIIEMLATYAAVAIENANLYNELRERDTALTRRNQDLALLNDVASALTSSLELDEILNKTLALVMNYLRMEAGEIFLLDDDKQTLRMVLHRGQAAEAFWTMNRFTVGEGLIGMVAKNATAIVSNDLENDVRYLREAVVKAGFRQMVCIPLISSENMVGVLSVATRTHVPIHDRDVQVLRSVGSWAGLAIENARLHQNARRLAVLEERDRIGMDLHDGIIQSIYGVGLMLENARLMAQEDPAAAQARLADAVDSLNHTIRDIRAYILDLRPRQLGSENVTNGLRRLLTEYRAHTLAEAALNAPLNGQLDDLAPAQSLALFHIGQEALANAAKHARAKKVTINIWTTDERVVMEVQDNGVGFDAVRMNNALGHGLSNMHTRARNIGGDVEISSNPGEGTTVMAWIPRRCKPQ
jgi:two-component system, NarL family, sensor histidine kinase DevS